MKTVKTVYTETMFLNVLATLWTTGNAWQSCSSGVFNWGGWLTLWGIWQCLNCFCHKQSGGSTEWVKAGVAAEHSRTVILWPRISLMPVQNPHCSCGPWERQQRTGGIKVRPRAENKRWKMVQLGWMWGTLFMPERSSSRENGIKDIPIHDQHTTTLPELYFPLERVKPQSLNI